MMAPIYILAAFAVLFVLFVIVRSMGITVCAACAAVAATWIGLFALERVGVRTDPIFTSALMGASATGIWYTILRKLPERFAVFSLPFLATLFLIIYFVNAAEFDNAAAGVAAGLWGAAVVVFLAYKKGFWKNIIQKAVECCKNW